jgi:hypothetical protein
MTTAEAALLERLIERLEELSAKARQGLLPPAEQAELETYGHVNQLIARLQAQARQILAPAPPAGEPTEPDAEVAPGIRRAQEAFWRDLPELLRTKRNQGQWVAYRQDERIGVSLSPQKLLRAIRSRGIPRDEYYLAVIRPHELPPWEPEQVEPIPPHHFTEDFSSPP